jgi:hypothetical protein
MYVNDIFSLIATSACLVITTVCSWYIMSRQYRGSNRPWKALLINNPRCPIPAEWVHKLSCSFVGDILTKVPHTGTFISSVHCPWELQLPMFEHFSIPILVHIKQVSVFDVKLCHYNPSKEAIAHVIEAQCTSNSTWGQNDSAWGEDDGIWGKWDDSSQSQSALGLYGSTLGWGPTPEAPQVDPCFPVLE